MYSAWTPKVFESISKNGLLLPIWWRATSKTSSMTVPLFTESSIFSSETFVDYNNKFEWAVSDGSSNFIRSLVLSVVSLICLFSFSYLISNKYLCTTYFYSWLIQTSYKTKMSQLEDELKNTLILAIAITFDLMLRQGLVNWMW